MATAVTITTVTDPVTSTNLTTGAASGTTDLVTNTVSVSVVDSTGATAGPFAATVIAGVTWSVANVNLTTLADGDLIWEATATALAGTQAFAAKIGEKQVSTNYITTAEFRTFVKDGSSLNATLINLAITTASRAIDQMCKRRFYPDGSATAKYFAPASIWALDFVDRDDQRWDIYTTTGLLVDVDQDGTGTYGTSYANNTQYQLSPVNQTKFGISGWPYEGLQILANGGQSLPLALPGFPETVRITAKWGWAAVPDAVKFAVYLAANRYFGRSEARYGTAGFDAVGFSMRIRTDPDIAELLVPFRDVSALVA